MRAELKLPEVNFYGTYNTTALHICVLIANLSQKAAIPLTTHPDLYDTVDQFLCSTKCIVCWALCIYHRAGCCAEQSTISEPSTE